MKLIILACLIAVAAAGYVPSAPIAGYSSPLSYSGYSPLGYSNFYNTPLAHNANPYYRSSYGYQSAPLAYSVSPYYRSPYFRSYPFY